MSVSTKKDRTHLKRKSSENGMDCKKKLYERPTNAPKWAKLVKRIRIKESCSTFGSPQRLLSLEEPEKHKIMREEFEARLIAYYHFQKFIDELYDSLCNENIRNELSDLLQFLSPKSTTTKLPLAILRSFTGSRDRKKFMRFLQISLARNTESAVCILYQESLHHSKKNLDMRRPNLLDYLISILLQCYELEQQVSLENISIDISRKSITSTRSAITKLIEWSQSTNHFDSIIVVLETPERTLGYTLDKLICVFQELRVLHRLPVSVVISPTQTEHHLLYTLQSVSTKTLMKEFKIWESHEILNIFLRKLFSELHTDEDALPILFGSQNIEILKSDFLNFHGSLFSTQVRIKAALAYHFRNKGSFLCCLASPSFTGEHNLLLQLFLVNKERRDLAFSGELGASCLTCDDILCRVRDIISVKQSLQTALELMILAMERCGHKHQTSSISMQSCLCISQDGIIDEDNGWLGESLKTFTTCNGDTFSSFSELNDLMTSWSGVISRRLNCCAQIGVRQSDPFELSSKDHKNAVGANILNIGVMLSKDQENEASKSNHHLVQSFNSRASVSNQHDAMHKMLTEINHRTFLLKEAIAYPLEEIDKQVVADVDLCFQMVKDYVIDAFAQQGKLKAVKLFRHFILNDSTCKDNHCYPIMFPSFCHMRRAVSEYLFNPENTMDVQKKKFDQYEKWLLYPCLAYQLMPQCMLNRKQWFLRFRHQLSPEFIGQDNVNHTKNEAHKICQANFTYALKVLHHCGLIRMVRDMGHSKQDIVFERVVVWASC